MSDAQLRYDGPETERERWMRFAEDYVGRISSSDGKLSVNGGVRENRIRRMNALNDLLFGKAAAVDIVERHEGFASMDEYRIALTKVVTAIERETISTKDYTLLNFMNARAIARWQQVQEAFGDGAFCISSQSGATKEKRHTNRENRQTLLATPTGNILQVLLEKINDRQIKNAVYSATRSSVAQSRAIHHNPKHPLYGCFPSDLFTISYFNELCRKHAQSHFIGALFNYREEEGPFRGYLAGGLTHLTGRVMQEVSERHPLVAFLQSQQNSDKAWIAATESLVPHLKREREADPRRSILSRSGKEPFSSNPYPRTKANALGYVLGRSEALPKKLRLTPRELVVLQKRFLDDMTLQEIGDEGGLTRGRIQQIEASAIEKMKKAIHWVEEREIKEVQNSIRTREFKEALSGMWIEKRQKQAPKKPRQEILKELLKRPPVVAPSAGASR